MRPTEKPPKDFDENPPLDDAFFAEATPALDDPKLARILAAASAEYRVALQAILAAHDAGAPIDDALEKARALVAAQ